MRILVTGVGNPTGAAIATSLAASGHAVRAFGVEPGTNPFEDTPRIEPFAGDVALQGSIEPVASQCQAIVHVAPLDRKATPYAVERGTLYARYAAERELVDRFVVLLPEGGAERAEAIVNGARVPHTILVAETPEAAADQVSRLLAMAEKDA